MKTSLRHAVVRLQKRFLGPENSKTTCPPGNLSPGTAPLSIVPALRRSGTHLLIDTILNNFVLYKREPFYVDLDRYLKGGFPVADLLNCRGYIVKTHFPQTLAFDFMQQVSEIAEQAFVLTPYRPLDDTFRSAKTFGATMSREELTQQSIDFDAYWQKYRPLRLAFSSLIDTTHYESLLTTIADHIGVAPNRKPTLPLSKQQRSMVYS